MLSGREDVERLSLRSAGFAKMPRHNYQAIPSGETWQQKSSCFKVVQISALTSN